METRIRIEILRIDHPLGSFTVTGTGIIQTKDHYDHVTKHAFALFGALGGGRDVDKPTKEDANDGPHNPA